MIIDRAIAAAERVARACVPDLVERPLYVTAPSTMATWGLFQRGLDRILQPILEAEGRWRGPGVAVLVDARRVVGDSFTEADATRRIVGIVLHELGHFVDRPDREPPGPVEPLETWVARVNDPDAEEETINGFPATFLDHGESFSRAMSHIWHRARTVGGMVLGFERLSFGSMYPGLGYLPHPSECVQSLQQELESRCAESLRDILATKPPTTYHDLWLRCYGSMPLTEEFVAQLGEV